MKKNLGIRIRELSLFVKTSSFVFALMYIAMPTAQETSKIYILFLPKFFLSWLFFAVLLFWIEKAVQKANLAPFKIFAEYRIFKFLFRESNFFISRKMFFYICYIPTLSFSIFVFFAAVSHNPQQVFDDNYSEIFEIWSSSFIVLFIPLFFLLIFGTVIHRLIRSQQNLR